MSIRFLSSDGHHFFKSRAEFIIDCYRTEKNANFCPNPGARWMNLWVPLLPPLHLKQETVNERGSAYIALARDFTRLTPSQYSPCDSQGIQILKGLLLK